MRMQKANQILQAIRKMGENDIPLTRVYRNLYCEELYLAAYGKLYRNKGALTPGTDPEDTIDAMNMRRIRRLIEALRTERFHFRPVRGKDVPKKSGGKRPLGMPNFTDKLMQEVLRMVLEAYYEPQFSDHSHGFRPKRGCHTALREVYNQWRGTTWFIEGDISKCFDTLDHQLMLNILAEKIHDGRFIALIDELLNAGYIEDWKRHKTLSGTPQGGVISPILSNIYLDGLDQWITNTLIPQYTRGDARQINPAYHQPIVKARHLERQGRYEEAKQLRRKAQQQPSKLPDDPTFRRLRYVRDADDFLLGFCGTKAEAEAIKLQIGEFLQNSLKLELSETKTLVTHARTENARFLSYHIHTFQDDTRRSSSGSRINGIVGLEVPKDVIRKNMKPYLKNGKPIHRVELIFNSDYAIIRQYQQEYRGIVEYYRLAYNIRQLEHLKYVMECSLTKTLARKYKISVTKVYKRYKTILQTEQGPRKGLQVQIEREGKKPITASWGGISLTRDLGASLNDAPHQIITYTRTELEQRVLANTCEICG